MNTISTLRTIVLFLIFFGGLTLVSCSKQIGCTDPNASNYDVAAEIDDESCIFQNNDNTDLENVNQIESDTIIGDYAMHYNYVVSGQYQGNWYEELLINEIDSSFSINESLYCKDYKFISPVAFGGEWIYCTGSTALYADHLFPGYDPGIYEKRVVGDVWFAGDSIYIEMKLSVENWAPAPSYSYWIYGSGVKIE